MKFLLLFFLVIFLFNCFFSQTTVVYKDENGNKKVTDASFGVSLLYVTIISVIVTFVLGLPILGIIFLFTY